MAEKISQLTPATQSNLSDLTEVSQVSGATYVTKSVSELQRLGLIYGSGVQTINTGAATTYTLTYPLAPRYDFNPNAGVGLNVSLPAYDATKCSLGQLFEVRNIGGSNSAVQLYDFFGNFIANTSIPPGASLITRLALVTGILTLDVIRFGTMAAQDVTAFLTANVNSKFQYAGPILNLDTATTGSTYTLSYPLPSVITVNTNTSNLILLFPAFDFSKCNPGQPIFVCNIGTNNVIPENSLGSQFGPELTSTQVALFTLTTASPDTITTAFVLSGMAYQAVPSWFSQTAATVLTNLGAASLNLIPNAQTSSYTLQQSDNGKIITFNSSSAVNCTVPNTLSADFNFAVLQVGTGQVTLVGSSVTLNSANSALKTRAQYSVASVWLSSASVGYAWGDLTQ